jgi:cell division topological specificity factor
MSLFKFLRRGSAPVARERLQILLAHERASVRSQTPDLLGLLREEILAVISRHVSFEPDKVQIKMDRGKSVSTLAIELELPNRDRVSEHDAEKWKPVFGKTSCSNETSKP